MLSGDTPLIEPETVRRAIAACVDGAGGALVSARLAPPHAYGRIVRDGDRVARIVEARDATPEELALDEFNVGLYCFRARRPGGGAAAADAAERAGRALPDRRDRAAGGRRQRRRRRRRAGARDGARASTRWPSWPSARPPCARASCTRTCWPACASSIRPRPTSTATCARARLPSRAARDAARRDRGRRRQRDRPVRDDRRRHDRRGLPRRAVRLSASRLHAGRRRAGRPLRRAQEHRPRRAAPRCRT